MKMKRKFTFSTVLCAGILATSGGARAGGLEISLGGVMNFQAAFAHNDSAFESGIFTREFTFANDTELHVNVEGRAASGLVYGAVIELEADVTADNRGEGLNADKTFIFVESKTGRVELGNNEGAEAAMAVNAASVARATGGIDGDDEFYINIAGVGAGATFLIHPDLPTADVGGVTEDATKITYYTPQIAGFQFGVSYTPDEGNGGTAAGFSGDTNSDMENVFGLGASYTAELKGVELNIGLVGASGNAEAGGTEDLGAWQLGGMVAYEGFSIAGSYGDWGNTGQPSGSGLDTDFWTLGAAYEAGEFGVSATYISSRRGVDEFNNLVFGVDYQLMEGMMPYAEVSFFEADQGGTGWIMMVQ